MSEPILRFIYRNHRGAVEERRVKVDEQAKLRLVYYPPEKNSFHPDGGWMLSGWCFDRAARRSFALKDIIGAIHEEICPE